MFEQVWLFWVCIIGSIATCCMLACSRKMAKTVPTNYIVLTLFTLFESWLVAMCCAMYSPEVVLMAACMTMAMFFGLTLYACTTKSDFTTMGGVLFAALFVFIIMGFFMAFLPYGIANTIYCAIGVILFSVYIVYDTQLIVGGKKHELSIDEYIFAALSLYLDIINLFLMILQLLGNKK